MYMYRNFFILELPVGKSETDIVTNDISVRNRVS